MHILKAGFEASLALVGGQDLNFSSIRIRSGRIPKPSPHAKSVKLRGELCQLCRAGENTVLPRRLGCFAMSWFMEAI